MTDCVNCLCANTKADLAALESADLRRVLAHVYWLFERYTDGKPMRYYGAKDGDPGYTSFCCDFTHHMAGMIPELKELGIKPMPNT